jgi:putative CocE/NonD family hydrolase
MTPTDGHWLGDEPRRRLWSRRVRATVQSLYLPMRDGVRIAVDVHVPRAVGKVPTLVRQTRYLRALDASPLFELLGVPRQIDLYAAWRRAFLAAGYAWVDVDVRGTGASSGTWHGLWFDEVADGAEIVSWIVKQPWSNGVVGSLGISYDGTTAELLLANAHPAVRAVAPLFSLYDMYADIAYPGGIQLSWFSERWAAFNAALDRSGFPEAAIIPIGVMVRAAAASPSPRGMEKLLAVLGRVDANRLGPLVRGLLGAGIRGVRPAGAGLSASERAQRADNVDIHAMSHGVNFRDDAGMHARFPERTADTSSPHVHRQSIASSGAAIYSYSGWRDGGYAKSAVDRFRSVLTPGSRLTLGPWTHSGRQRVHAFGLGQPTDFDHLRELLDFFDEHLKGIPSRGDGKPVHYFTMGEERWKSTSTWPPPGSVTRAFFLGPGRTLVGAAPSAVGQDVLETGASGTGDRTRWRSLLSLVPGDYPDRAQRDVELLVYDSPPLEVDLEVTGTPQVVVHASWDRATDGRVFVYLEDHAPDGRVNYVTEGQLRALHRKVSDGGERTFRSADAMPLAPREVAELPVSLLPVSHLFRRGHRVRLAIARADVDHFARAGEEGAMSVHRGRSRLVLPCAGR